MIVVMKKGSLDSDVEGVMNRVTELGLGGHLIRGEERTVIGVVGQTYPDLGPMLEILPGVDEIVPISKPYKLSGRELHPHDTIVAAENVPEVEDVNPDRVRYELTPGGKVAHLLKRW